MQLPRGRRTRRIAAGIISFMMLAFVVLSSVLITAEVHHDCSGHNCPVCATIAHCEQILRGGADSACCRTFAYAPLLFFVACFALYAFLFSPETPVSRKTRLNP